MYFFSNYQLNVKKLCFLMFVEFFPRLSLFLTEKSFSHSLASFTRGERKSRNRVGNGISCLFLFLYDSQSLTYHFHRALAHVIITRQRILIKVHNCIEKYGCTETRKIKYFIDMKFQNREEDFCY